MHPHTRAHTLCRTDIHGEIGTASLPLTQRAALYARATVLLPPRAAALLAGTLFMRFVCLLCVWLPALRAILLAPAASGIGRALLFVCGVVRVRHTDWRHRGCAGAPPVRSRDDTAVVVSNHVSWLDILMVQVHLSPPCTRRAWASRHPAACSTHSAQADVFLGSLGGRGVECAPRAQAYYAAAFVTRVETSRTPVIGGICDALPCIYVDRDKGGGGADAPVGSSTTAKLTARINVKHAQPSAPLRPVVAFVEVRRAPSATARPALQSQRRKPAHARTHAFRAPPPTATTCCPSTRVRLWRESPCSRWC